MKRITSEEGFAGGVIFLLFFVSLVAIGAIVFGVWAFNGRQQYKNNANTLIATAVQVAKTNEAAIKDQQYQVASQNPFISYTGPQQYGSVYVSYPKTWSGYVDASGGGGGLLEEYFNPGVLPPIEAPDSIYALRIEVNSNSYSSNLATFTSNQQSSNLTITPYSLPKVSSVIGVMVQGQIEPNMQGTLVMFPLRTNTLEIWTESTQYNSLLTSQILPSVSFQP